MSSGTRIRRLVLLLALAASVGGSLAALMSPPVEAARCCRVMVCSNTPPYACWEECRTCPKFP